MIDALKSSSRKPGEPAAALKQHSEALLISMRNDIMSAFRGVRASVRVLSALEPIDRAVLVAPCQIIFELHIKLDGVLGPVCYYLTILYIMCHTTICYISTGPLSAHILPWQPLLVPRRRRTHLPLSIAHHWRRCSAGAWQGLDSLQLQQEQHHPVVITTRQQHTTRQVPLGLGREIRFSPCFKSLSLLLQQL